MNCICIGLLCLLPQTPETSEPPARSVPSSELVMEVYTPQYMEARELERLASDLAGSQFKVVDADLSVRRMRSLRRFEDAVLIYETAERAQTLLALLEKLDSVAADQQKQRDAADVERDQQMSAQLTTRQYSPRYLSLDDLRQALLPYRQRYPGGFEFVDDAGFMVLAVSDDLAENVLSFLKQVDVPAPQLEISCYIVRGVDAPAANPAPADLTAGLRDLIGYEHLEVRAHSMLRTSSSAERLSLRLDVDGPPYYDLEMHPAAYAEADGALTLAECALFRGNTGIAGATSVFSTETTIYCGEYTVLGAAGAAPELVVIRCRRAGGAVSTGKATGATSH
ncbi:MAG: hypothetical protein ACI8QZ_002732 [Chlamydiales bacterium]|jgi:hypothetical protein